MINGTRSEWFRLTALICATLLTPGEARLIAQPQSPPGQQPPEAPKLKSADQLDSLVAPIALYPDPLLARVLGASTYPVEIVEANRGLKANTTLKGEDLTKAAVKQPWDASVQALVAFPGALKRLDENLRWTTELGNAVLDQQSAVMDAVQRMRMKAKSGGKLESTKEQKVEVKTGESKTVIEIQPSNPQVVYVPSYDPVVVYGAAPAYAYPPLYYPPYYPTAGAVAATAAVSFGVGVMMGAFWGGGGGYGWGCSWGGSANININNNFNNRYGYNNISGGNRVNAGNNWQHNPAHRRATPYSNAGTARQYGGTARGPGGEMQRFDSRTGQARSQADRAGQNRGSADRSGIGGDRGQSGGRDRGGNQDRIGNRNIENRDRASQKSALGGGESRGRTQAASDRGFNSSRGSRGSGFSGGGGRSFGGGRSGGGRRR